MEHQWIWERCREVQDNPDGYLDLWSREHYKSTVITFGLTIQDILRTHGDGAEGEECTIGIFSHTRPIAKGFLSQIKWELESNKVLQENFPDILYKNPKKDSPRWSEDGGIVVKRKGNPKESTVEAWGLVDGQPTGKHFSKLVYDDVVTWPGSVSSPDMIKKTTNAFKLSLNLGARGGEKRIIGTRYAFGDSYNAIEKTGTAKLRQHPGTKDGTETGEPVLLTREEIAQKRRDMGPYIFACQILLNPVEGSSQSFKAEWITRYYDVNQDKLNKYLLCDPASSKKRNSDYTAMVVLGIGEDENIYLLDAVYDRLSLSERQKAYFALHRQYRPLESGYEQYGMQADIEHFQSVMERESYRFKITDLGGKLAKDERIKRLIPDFEEGKILFPAELPRRRVDGSIYDPVEQFLDEEYEAFPVGVHDDFFDCLSRIKDLNVKIPGGRQKVKLDYSRLNRATAGSPMRRAM